MNKDTDDSLNRGKGEDGATAKKVFTPTDIAGTKLIAFQGGVYDLEDFAVSHPGGSELITDWYGKDGTDALLEAHPGGKAFIKHTLSDADFAAAFKGTIPYEKKKRTPNKKTKRKRGDRKDAGVSLLTQLKTSFGSGLARIAVVVPIVSGAAMILSKPSLVGLPEDWPNHEQLLHMVIGALVSMILFKLSVWCGMSTLTMKTENKQSSGSGSGFCGWSYNKVSPQLVDELIKICHGDDQVYSVGEGEESDMVLKRHSQDMGFHKRALPDVVVFPETKEQVQQVVKAAFKANVPLVPRGAGSGLEGGAIPYQGGVVLDLMRMKQFAMHEADLQCTVGPGIKKVELNEKLKSFGLLFGPDPASNPSIGGMASTRGSGLSTLMYGTTAENIVSLEVVTPDGRLIKTRSRVRKSSTGYEVTQLYVGSEGTLGIIVSLTVKLRKIPKVRCGAFIGFKNIEDAATATIALVRAGLGTLCRCELLNSDGIRATNKKYGTGLPVRPTIFLEYRSDTRATCTSDAAQGEAIILENGAEEYKFADKGEELDRLWEARRGCYMASIAYSDRKGDRVYLSDTCVPISKIAKMIAETEEDFVSHGFPCIICAHIADGNFHCCIPYQPEQLQSVKEIETKMIRRALSLEGTVSGEHGVGVGKIPHVLEEHGADHIEVQRAIKRALDPTNIMNPQKIFILPHEHGGCCDIPKIYSETESGAGGGTYKH